jgi:hypothetical protein
MKRLWMITSALLLTGLVLYLSGKLGSPSRASVALVPFQQIPSPYGDTDSSTTGCSAVESFEELSAALADRGIELANPRALNSLSTQSLGVFVDRAVACPAAYFSQEHSRFSGSVVAAWLQRQSFSRIRPHAWRTCLKLRWTAASIFEIADPCRKAMSPLGRRWGRGRLDWAETLVSIEEPGERLEQAARRYANNPYCGEALAELALELHRQRHPELANRLKNELMQISVDKASRLEHKMAGQMW